MKNKRPMSHLTGFWIFHLFLSLCCLLLVLKFYPTTFPSVDLKITMDRHTAMATADLLAKTYHWGPKGFHQTAGFELDVRAQTFIELTAGGSKAFAQVLRGQLYSPYTWRVRHFAEGSSHETLIQFTPDGKLYSFFERVPEDAKFPNLPSDQARTLAERGAQNTYQVDLSPFQLVENSHETRPNGRVDHFFVYERLKETLGEGKYRLKLTITGDHLSGIENFIQIPEAFLRHYSEMRSSNDTIYLLATFAVGILYVLGGCGFGVFYLARRNWLLWKQPLMWGGVVAGLQFFEQLNQLPLVWMRYDTALPELQFLLRTFFMALLGFLGEWILLTFSFLSAESLTRRAFPSHPQFWKIWQTRQASSYSLLGRTLGGYLGISVLFAFTTLTYWMGTHHLGWWIPSDILYNPDALSSYCPWFTSIARSLHAAFWEECLFRAIPLAGCALLGKHFKNETRWMIGGLILQALIFSAAHANYPAQPSYARMLELLIPSLLFGALYIRYGLLPGIILHFGFDVVSFSLPLFIATTSFIWADRLFIVGFALVPLWVFLVSWIRQKKLRSLSSKDLNSGWTPRRGIPATHLVPPQAKGIPLNSDIVGLLGGLALTSILIWFFAADSKRRLPTLNIYRDRAIEIAWQVLEPEGISPVSTTWTPLAHTLSRIEFEDRFVWETAGQERYYDLVGTYLNPPVWMVRFVRFGADVSERADEYQVFLTHQGKVLRVKHELPEARSGSELKADQATQIALEKIKTFYSLTSENLREVSTIAYQLPHRRDWRFTFADKSISLPNGEARISVQVSGDQATSSRQHIFVPEEWIREERKKQNILSIIGILSAGFSLVFLVFVLIQALIQWTQRKLNSQIFRNTFFFLMFIEFIQLINSWPSIIASFSTSQPLLNQIVSALSMQLLRVSAYSLGGGLAHSWIQQGKRKKDSLPSFKEAVIGYSAGLIGPILLTFLVRAYPEPRPMMGDLGALDKLLPSLFFLQPLEHYIFVTLEISIVALLGERLTHYGTKRMKLGTLFYVLVGLCQAGAYPHSPERWIGIGLISGFYLLLLCRSIFHAYFHLIPLVTGGFMIFQEWKQMKLHPYIGSTTQGWLNVFILILFSFQWHHIWSMWGKTRDEL